MTLHKMGQRIGHRIGLAALLALGIAAPAFAQGAGQAADPAVTAPIAALDAALAQGMRSGRSVPFDKRYAAMAPAVEHAFDLRAVLQAAVGLAWGTLPPDQQQQLLAAFTRFTVSTYVSNFDGGDSHFEMVGTRGLGAEQVVETQIVSGSGDKTRIDYVMRQDAGQWRAVDVLLDGSISRAAVMRSDFRAPLESGGAEKLIQILRKKTEALAAGSKS